MSGWMYNGYTKVKVGNGRNRRYKELHEYKCLHCGKSIRIDYTQKPPTNCPNCGADMRKGGQDAVN